MVNPYSDLIKEVFGEDAPKVEEILSRNGGKEGENTQYNPKKMDPNRDTNGKIKQIYNPYSGKYEDSYDYGLMRDNNQPFWDIMTNAAGNKFLAENGITKFEDLGDPKKSLIYTALLINGLSGTNLEGRGWKQWFAGPPDTNPNYTTPAYTGKQSDPMLQATSSATPKITTPTPTPTPRPTGFPPRRSNLLSPIPGDEYVPSTGERIAETIKSGLGRVGEEISTGVNKLFGSKVYEFGPVSQGFGTKNPADIYTKGINYGTDFSVAKGTPVMLPQGNWKILESFNGATAEGPNNPQRGINKGYWQKRWLRKFSIQRWSPAF